MSSSEEQRRTCLARRDELDPGEHRLRSAKIRQNILHLSAWYEAEAVLFFLPFRSEVDIAPLLLKAWDDGKAVYASRCIRSSRELKIARIISFDDLSAGAWGIKEAKPELAEVDPRVLDLVFVPGAVFDPKGHRLGYGAGFYDRFLPRCRQDALRLAPHFSLQLVDAIAVAAHDQAMDILVNEDEVIVTAAR